MKQKGDLLHLARLCRLYDRTVDVRYCCEPLNVLHMLSTLINVAIVDDHTLVQKSIEKLSRPTGKT